MNSRENEPLVLDDEFYDSAMPEMIRVNISAQNQASLMFAKKHPEAPETLDIELVPAFMRNPDGSLIDRPRSTEFAENVLAALHEAWKGTEPLEHQHSDTYTERFWEYVDENFFPWTVTESINTNPTGNSIGVSAHMTRARRPGQFQKLINRREGRDVLSESNYAHESSRHKRLGAKITKLAKRVKKDTGYPHDKHL